MYREDFVYGNDVDEFIVFKPYQHLVNAVFLQDGWHDVDEGSFFFVPPLVEWQAEGLVVMCRPSAVLAVRLCKEPHETKDDLGSKLVCWKTLNGYIVWDLDPKTFG